MLPNYLIWNSEIIMDILGAPNPDTGWRTVRFHSATGLGYMDERHASSDSAIQDARSLVSV